MEILTGTLSGNLVTNPTLVGQRATDVLGQEVIKLKFYSGSGEQITPENVVITIEGSDYGPLTRTITDTAIQVRYAIRERGHVNANAVIENGLLILTSAQESIYTITEVYNFGIQSITWKNTIITNIVFQN